MFQPVIFLVGGIRGRDVVDVPLLPGHQQIEQRGQPLAIRQRPLVFTVEFQQIETVERFAHGFTVQDEVTGNRVGRNKDRRGQSDVQSLAIDAVNGRSLLAHQHPPAIELFLHGPLVVRDEPFDFIVVGCIEQLRQNSRRARLGMGVLIRRAVLAGRVALGGLLFDELVEDAPGIWIIDWHVGLRPGVEGRASASVGDVHDEAFARRFDAALIHFVGCALAVVERDAVWFCCGHGFFSFLEMKRAGDTCGISGSFRVGVGSVRSSVDLIEVVVPFPSRRRIR